LEFNSIKNLKHSSVQIKEMHKIRIVFILILINCSGSTPKDLHALELAKFANDPRNNLRKDQNIGPVHLSLTYRPTDLLVHQELDSEEVTKSLLDSTRNKYGKFHYFVLSMSRDERELLTPANMGSSYSELVEVFSFRMSQYVTMTTSKQDTIYVADYTLNRSYGIAASTDLLFAFPKEKTTNTEWVQFNMNEFGLGIGNHRFRFDTHDLEDAPHIAFKVK
jgi:hypothetical protein